MPIIKLLVEGGKMTPGPAVAQQLGPMGINMGKVISDVNSATAEFKGITVPVELDVDAQTKEFTIKVLSPPTAELLKKEMGVEKASGARMQTTVGNLAIEQIISVSKTKHENLLSNDFISTVKSVIGTAMAIGAIVESKDPKIVLEEIEQGKYKEEIENQKTELSAEKQKELASYFSGISKQQEEVAKQKEEESAAEKEAKESKVEAAAEEPKK